jgi:hypothetical protein
VSLGFLDELGEYTDADVGTSVGHQLDALEGVRALQRAVRWHLKSHERQEGVGGLTVGRVGGWVGEVGGLTVGRVGGLKVGRVGE